MLPWSEGQTSSSRLVCLRAFDGLARIGDPT